MNQTQFNRANEINNDLLTIQNAKARLEKIVKNEKRKLRIQIFDENSDYSEVVLPAEVMRADVFASDCLVNIEELIYKLEKEFEKL